MRTLLDACVPRRLARGLTDHAVTTVPEMGWADWDDGPLLDAMADQFDFLVIVDKGLPNQQRLSHRAFGVVILRCRSNRLDDLLPIVPTPKNVLASPMPGQVVEIFATSTDPTGP